MKILINGLQNDKHLNETITEVIEENNTQYLIYDLLRWDYVTIDKKYCTEFIDEYDNLICLPIRNRMFSKRVYK